MGVRDDEPTQVTRLRKSLRGACAAEALELESVRNSAVEVGRTARARPSSHASFRLTLIPKSVEEDLDDDETDPELDARSDDGTI